MLSVVVAPEVRKLADRYKDLTDIGYGELCALISYFWMGLTSLSAAVRTMPWSSSVSTLQRSLQRVECNRFMRRMRSSILRRYGDRFNVDDFIWAIDDTANPKYGKNMFRAGHWHGSSGPWFGQKVVVLALVDMKRQCSIPVSYCIAPKKSEEGHKTGHELAIQLLEQVLGEGFPRLSVVTDSWFDSAAFMESIEKLGMTHVGELKNNRKVRTNPGRFVPWTSLSEVFRGRLREQVTTVFDLKRRKQGRKTKQRFAAHVRIWIRSRSSCLNAIAVYNRKNGKDAFGYYVSTDRTMSRSRIWEISRARWKIEVMFRDLKQHLSFGRLQCGGAQAADLSICLPMLIYVSLKLRDENEASQETIGDSVDKLRENMLCKAIDVLIRKRTTVNLDKLRARRHPDRLNKKPVDRLAEAA